MSVGRHYLYTHTSPSGKVYVGQTVNIKRRWGYNGEHYRTKKKDGSYVQASFARAIDKYGWDAFKHTIILEKVSKSEADYAEKYLIKWYKLHNTSYNITDGGEGTCGVHRILSEEEKEIIKRRVQLNPPMKGKHHSEETKKKISAFFKGRKLSDERKKHMSEISKGRKHSEESKKKMSDYKRNHPETWIGGWNKIEVHQYDLDGNYVTSYPSVVDAANAIGRNDGDISKCIRGEVASAAGFIWKKEKVEHVDMSDYKIVKTAKGARVLDMSKSGKLKRSAAHGKPVNQYTIEGGYINTYCTASEAARQTGINYSGINRCCKHEYRFKTAGGYKWEFDNGNNRVNISVI